MQTSFMHPPFGYALFYLRSVAPAREYVDKLLRKPLAGVTTGQIYWGAVPFVVIQVIMVAIVIVFPRLVTGNLDKLAVDPSKVKIEVPMETQQQEEQDTAPPDFGAPSGSAAPKKK
jgi:GntP family gluconate:H+ symporter